MNRKEFVIVLAMMMCITATGCGSIFGSKAETTAAPKTEMPPANGTPLIEFMNDPVITDFAENFEQNFPVAVYVLYQDVSGGEPYKVTDETTIRNVFRALSNMTVMQEAGFAHSDDYLDYYFEMEDGSNVVFSFQQGMFMDKNYCLYEVAGFDMLTQALSYPSTPIIGKTRTYNLIACVDPEYQMEAFRTLIPDGWNAYGTVNWNYASATAPANCSMGAFSEDGKAGFLRNTDQHYVNQIYSGGGSSNNTIASPDGTPLRIQSTSIEMTYEIMPQIYNRVTNMHITGLENADPDGILLSAYQKTMAGEFATARQIGTNVSDVYCTIDAVYGTATIDGIACEFEAYITMGGYTLTSKGNHLTITSHYWSVLNSMFFYAPVGRMADYIDDMMLIMDNYVENDNWMAVRHDVTGQLKILLQQKQLQDWARAHEFSKFIYSQAYYNRNPSSSYASVIGDRQDASSFWHKRWEEALTGKETYDLGGGGSVTVDGNYDRVYSNSSGSIIGSNDPMFEPGPDYAQLNPVTR